MSEQVHYVTAAFQGVPLECLEAASVRAPFVVLSPSLCPAAILELPRASRYRRLEMARLELHSLLPDQPTDSRIGLVHLSGRGAGFVLAFSLSAEVQERLERELPDRVMVPAALLLHASMAVAGDSSASLALPDSTLTLSLAGSAPPALTVSREGRGAGATIDLAGADAAIRRAVRQARRLSAEPRPAFAAARLLLPIAVIAGVLWLRVGASAREGASELRELSSASGSAQAADGRAQSASARVAELERELAALSASRLPSPYSLLELVYRLRRQGTRIDDFLTSGSSFELRGSTADAAALARDLGAAAGITSALLQESAPTAGGGERFVIRGSYALD